MKRFGMLGLNLLLLIAQGAQAFESSNEQQEKMKSQKKEVATAVDLLVRTGIIQRENSKLVIDEPSLLEKLREDGLVSEIEAEGGVICL